MDNVLAKLEHDIKNNLPIKKDLTMERGSILPYTHIELLNILKSIDTMKDEELYFLLEKDYSLIFTQIFKSNSKDFDFLLRSTKFISIMIQVLTANEIKSDDRVHLNSFIYNFLIYNDETEENSYLRQLLFMLGETINKKTARRLFGCDLDERLSIFLAISVNSTFKPHVNIKRLNFTLATAAPSIITTEKVINIYESIFDSVTELITGTVFDTDIVSNYGKPWVTNEVINADNCITNAVLLILESMPPIEITKVLMAISCDYRWKNCEEGISKVNFDNLDKRIFNKTNIILEQLKGDGYIFP